MCFSLDWLMHIIILGIIVCAIIAILRVVVPFVLSQMGATIGAGANVVITCFKIALWAVIAIIVVVICFQIIACLWSFSGTGGFSLIPRR